MRGVEELPDFQSRVILCGGQRGRSCDTWEPCASLLVRMWGVSCVPRVPHLTPSWPLAATNKALPRPGGCREVELVVACSNWRSGKGDGEGAPGHALQTRAGRPAQDGSRAVAPALLATYLAGRKPRSWGSGTHRRRHRRRLLRAASPAGRKAGTSCGSLGGAESGPFKSRGGLAGQLGQ